MDEGALGRISGFSGRRVGSRVRGYYFEECFIAEWTFGSRGWDGGF